MVLISLGKSVRLLTNTNFIVLYRSRFSFMFYTFHVLLLCRTILPRLGCLDLKLLYPEQGMVSESSALPLYILHISREHKVLLIQLPYLALEQGVILDREPLSVKVSDERFTCLFSANKFYPKIATV